MPERDPSLPELPVGAATPDTVRGSWGTGEGTALDHVVRWPVAVPPRRWEPDVDDDDGGDGE